MADPAAEAAAAVVPLVEVPEQRAGMRRTRDDADLGQPPKVLDVSHGRLLVPPDCTPSASWRGAVAANGLAAAQAPARDERGRLLYTVTCHATPCPRHSTASGGPALRTRAAARRGLPLPARRGCRRR